MTRILCALLAVLFTAAPSQAQSLKEMLDKLRQKWDAPTEPFRVIGNIHYVGTAGLASYLITSPQGHVLIDTVMPGNTDKITKNIEKLGFKVSDIKVMLNTQAHLDHTGGFAEIKKAVGAQMIAGEGDKQQLETGTYQGRETQTELNFPPVKVDRTVKEGDLVEVGPIKITARATPGHSPGCTTWTMDVEEKGQKHGVIFFCSLTVALNQLVGKPSYPGIIEDYKRTIATSGRIKGDVLLAPHPEMFGMDEKRAAIKPDGPNPFVKAGEYEAYMTKMAGLFEAGLAKQQDALKKQ